MFAFNKFIKHKRPKTIIKTIFDDDFVGDIAITSVYFLQHPEILAILKKDGDEVADLLLRLLLLTFLPVIVSMMLMSIVACLDNLSCCACSCCCDCCLPMTERDSIFKTEKEDTNETHELVAVNQEAERIFQIREN